MMMKTKKSKFKFKNFSKKQRKLLNWWCPDSPANNAEGIIADGAIRSGKTLCMSLSFVIWAMSSFENQHFAMCGKTIGSFRRNVLFSLKIVLKSRGYVVIDHRTDNLLEISRKGIVNYFHIFGGKDERSQGLIQGITLAGLFLDEVALMPESFVNQATGRCSVDGSKYWFNCNPDGPYHWFKVKWIDKREKKKLLLLHFYMNDNLSLSQQIKDRYQNMYTGVFFQRFILGLWVMAEGIVYDMFNKDVHLVTELPDFAEGYKYISIDYGTQNPTAFLLWERESGGRWICSKEYHYSGREKGIQKTDAQYADDLIDFIGNLKIKDIIVDPSAASFIAELKSRGLHVKEAKNDVLDGIRFVGTLLKQEKLGFYKECRQTIKEFGSYIWDAKASDHGEDKPIKQFDHCMDAMRYFCFTILYKPKANKVTNSKKLNKENYWNQ